MTRALLFVVSILLAACMPMLAFGDETASAHEATDRLRKEPRP